MKSFLKINKNKKDIWMASKRMKAKPKTYVLWVTRSHHQKVSRKPPWLKSGLKYLDQYKCEDTGERDESTWKEKDMYDHWSGTEDQLEGRERCAVPPFVSAMESVAVRKIRHPSFQGLVCAGWYKSRGWDGALGMNFIVSFKWFI